MSLIPNLLIAILILFSAIISHNRLPTPPSICRSSTETIAFLSEINSINFFLLAGLSIYAQLHLAASDLPEKDNPYVLTNNLISKIKFNYNQNNKINNSEIVDFYKKSFDIVSKNLKKIDTSETQIYRQNSEDLNCFRHFRIFNKFNVIPKFCFGCFKVTVQTETVLDLLKLYFVFDKLYLGLQNTRKLMIEERKDVSGNYKGFIYCSSVEEGENIKNKLKSILIKNLGTDCSISLKRGCSEFALKYPSYKKASANENEMMPYDETWKSLEEIVDNRTWNTDSKKGIIHPSLTGPTLRDILIMRHWLLYANKIGDNSFVKA